MVISPALIHAKLDINGVINVKNKGISENAATILLSAAAAAAAVMTTTAMTAATTTVTRKSQKMSHMNMNQKLITKNRISTDSTNGSFQERNKFEFPTQLFLPFPEFKQPYMYGSSGLLHQIVLDGLADWAEQASLIQINQFFAKYLHFQALNSYF